MAPGNYTTSQSTAGYCYCLSSSTSTGGAWLNGCRVFYVDVLPTQTRFDRLLEDFKKSLTRAQLAQRAAATRARLMRPPVERPVAPVSAVNAGMALRRMRASTGLARGRA